MRDFSAGVEVSIIGDTSQNDVKLLFGELDNDTPKCYNTFILIERMSLKRQ